MAEETINPNLRGLDVNYAVGNKWIAYFPLESVLGTKFNNLELHLTKFSLPQIEMGSTSVSFKGYTKTIPTKVQNADTKTLTLDYIVDQDWRNYKSLFLWMSSINGTINPSVSDETSKVQPTDYLPLRIYLLDNYKKKIIQFLFTNCWIQTFNEVQLASDDPNEVHHSFQICYDSYTIENV